jgi:hypothetical protein
MMKKYIVFILFIAMVSCSSKQVPVPDNILDEKEMTTVMTDLHIAQVEMNQRTRTDKDVKADDYVELVLRKNKIERKKFLESLKFYTDNPEILGVIYDSVLVQLNKNSLRPDSL